MSHMIADTLDELEQMARDLGLKPEWRQRSRRGVIHYDVCESKRKKAIGLGAVPVSSRELALRAMIHRGRERGD